MRRRTKKDLSHVRMGSGNGEMVCRNCGRSYTVNMPCSIEMWASSVEVFSKEHADCQVQTVSPAALDEAKSMTPDQWLASGDTGISSLTIWSVMTGWQPHARVGGPPVDPADFGRCYRLLQRFPAWRERLPEVAAKWPLWDRLIANWDRLEALYVEELPSGRAPKLYTLMQDLSGP